MTTPPTNQTPAGTGTPNKRVIEVRTNTGFYLRMDLTEELMKETVAFLCNLATRADQRKL